MGRCQQSRGRSLMGLRLPHPRPGVAARPQPGLAMGRLSLVKHQHTRVLGTSKGLGRKSQASWAVRKLREQGLGLAKSAWAAVNPPQMAVRKLREQGLGLAKSASNGRPRSTSLGRTSYSAPKTCGLEEASYRPHEADCGPQGPSTASRRPNLASSRPCARSQNGKPDAPVRFNRRPLNDQNKTRSYSGPK